MVWDSSEIVVLNSSQAIDHGRLRRVQLGLESQYFTAWMMTQYQPQPLYSDISERQNAVTARLMSAWRDREEKKEAAHPDIMSEGSKTGVAKVVSGNAVGEDVAAPPSEV